MEVPNFKRDDPKLRTIMSEGLEGDAVVIGFPFDEGVARNGGRRGAELGPDCVRRFLPNIGPIYNCELDIDLSNFRVSDYGNIEAHDFETAHQKLKNKVLRVLNKEHKPFPIILGGGNDQSYSNGLAFLEFCENNSYQPVIINIDAHLDVRTLNDEGQIHSGCPFRLLVEHEKFVSRQGLFYEFACQGSQCAKAHVDFVKERGGHLTWLKEIRCHNTQTFSSYLTQAGQMLFELVESLPENSRVFMSFDIDSVNSAFCPGVSAPSVVGGLTAEEAMEIGLVSGRSKKVVMLDISEFNPAVEDYRTGKFIANIVYHTILGLAQFKLS